MRLLISGGGTGGHLYPGVAVAEELLARGEGHEVHFAGAAQGIEARVVPQLGHPFTPVRCRPLVGRGVTGKASALWAVAMGIGDARALVRRFAPDACLGVGGYASFPVAAAARMGGVFTALQEQNAAPGLTNRLLGRVAHRIYASDQAAAGSFEPIKTIITGTPLRTSFGAPRPYDPPRTDVPTRVLVLGGSQGAKALNDLVPRALAKVPHPLEVIHQAGRGKDEPVRTAYGAMRGVKVETFIDDMAAVYRWAQVIIARSGALTLAEVAAVGKPAILVPYPFAADNHQEANARSLERIGAALTLCERELTEEGLAATVARWIEEPATPTAMAEKIRAVARPDAAARIVDDLIAHAGGGENG